MCSGNIGRTLVIWGALLFTLALTAGPALAQEPQIEIHPYAGGFFPGKWADTSHLKNEGMYGIRGGVYLIDFVQLDANFAYINHFRFKDAADSATRAYLWDFNAYYSLNGYNIKKAEPFVGFGVGGLTTGIHNSSVAAPTPTAPLKDNDTFLQFTYGGGMKTIRMWGPIGLRADIRGRTVPNFYGHGLTWFEATAGFNVIWGER